MARHRKELLRPGSYWIEDSKGNPVRFDVSKDDIAEMLDAGRSMLRRHIKIPVPLEHQPVGPVLTESQLGDFALLNTGWVEGFDVDSSNRLYADLEIKDKAVEAKLGSTIKYVSPFIGRFTCPVTGEQFRKAICHVGITPTPRFVDQEPFSSFALSNSRKGGVYLSLSHCAEERKRLEARAMLRHFRLIK